MGFLKITYKKCFILLNPPFGFYLFSYLQGLFLHSNLGSRVHLNATILYLNFSREAVNSLFPDYLPTAFKRELAGSYFKHLLLKLSL